jgi:hypothetical protein
MSLSVNATGRSLSSTVGSVRWPLLTAFCQEEIAIPCAAPIVCLTSCGSCARRRARRYRHPPVARDDGAKNLPLRRCRHVAFAPDRHGCGRCRACGGRGAGARGAGIIVARRVRRSGSHRASAQARQFLRPARFSAPNPGPNARGRMYRSPRRSRPAPTSLTARMTICRQARSISPAASRRSAQERPAPREGRNGARRAVPNVEAERRLWVR